MRCVAAGRFAAMVGAFCARLGWTDLEALVTKFQQRVFFGVRPEVSLLQVMLLPVGSRHLTRGGHHSSCTACTGSMVLSQLLCCLQRQLQAGRCMCRLVTTPYTLVPQSVPQM